MGYLDNKSITVDAILTKKGRELLAKGRNEFNIKYFALADDEIDYTLWNPNHKLGTAYFGKVIEDLPITEAVPDETQMLKYKLVSLPRNTVRIPIVEVPNNSIELAPGSSDIITPNTINYPEGNSTYGYTAVISNSNVVSLEVVEESVSTGAVATPPTGYLHSDQSVSLIGKSFRIKAKSAISGPKSVTLTIFGNETGGQTVINIFVRQTTKGQLADIDED